MKISLDSNKLRLHGVTFRERLQFYAFVDNLLAAKLLIFFVFVDFQKKKNGRVQDSQSNDFIKIKI